MVPVGAILTDRQTQDVLRRGQGEAKAPSVGADFLFKQTACHCVIALVKSVYISKTLKLLQPKQIGILKLMTGTGEDMGGDVAHRAKQTQMTGILKQMRATGEERRG